MTGTPNPIQRSGGHRAKRSERFTPCPDLYCMSRFTALLNAKQVYYAGLLTFQQDSRFTKQMGIFRG